MLVMLGSSMSKALALMLFSLLVLSSSAMVGSVFAQSIPKPSVPEFTLKYVTESKEIAPSTTIDPYTGNTITNPGYVLTYRIIEIAVENQPFSPYTEANGNYINVYYNVSFKGHHGDTWSHYPDGTYMSVFNASDSEYTVIRMSLGSYPSILDGSELDFRLEALLGHYNYAQAPDGTKYVTGFSVYETSGWSDTQTIRIGESQTSSPEPTSTPTSSPSQENLLTQEQSVILGLTLAVAVLAVGLGLLLYLIKRK